MNEASRSDVPVSPVLAVLFLGLMVINSIAYICNRKKNNWSLSPHEFSLILFFGVILFAEVCVSAKYNLNFGDIKTLSVQNKMFELLMWSFIPLAMCVPSIVLPAFNAWLKKKKDNKGFSSAERYILLSLYFWITPILVFFIGGNISKIFCSIFTELCNWISILIGIVVYFWIVLACIIFLIAGFFYLVEDSEARFANLSREEKRKMREQEEIESQSRHGAQEDRSDREDRERRYEELDEMCKSMWKTD